MSKNLTYTKDGPPSRYTAEKAVKDLIAWVNHEDLFSFNPGTIRSANGLPVVKVERLTMPTERERKMARQLLSQMADPGNGSIDETISRRGVDSRLFADVTKPDAVATIVPVANSALDVIYAVVLLARVTPTLQGDALSNRVSECQRCEKFYLKKTRLKPSRFCGRACFP